MPQPKPSPVATAPRRFSWRRLVQYRLRTLLIVTTVVAVWLGWWTRRPTAVSFEELRFTNEADLVAKRSEVAAPRPQIAGLNGRIVEVSGQILPPFRRHSLRQAILVPETCLNVWHFEPHEVILLNLADGTEFDWAPGGCTERVKVTGRLEFNGTWSKDGMFYRISDARVEGPRVVARPISKATTDGTSEQKPES